MVRCTTSAAGTCGCTGRVPAARPWSSSHPFYKKIFASWPAGVREPLVANHTTLAWQRVGAEERSDMPALRDEIKAAGPVPDRPLIALTALGIDPGMRLFRSKATLLRLNEGKRRLDKALAASACWPSPSVTRRATGGTTRRR